MLIQIINVFFIRIIMLEVASFFISKISQ